MSSKPLQGHAILIVEDNALIALNLEDVVQHAGATVACSVARLDEATRAARDVSVTCAVLDIMLDDVEVWPVARILAERGIPFVFSSGHYEPDTLPPEWAGHRIVPKPAQPKAIVAALRHAIDDRSASR